MTTIRELQDAVHLMARDKGWWDRYSTIRSWPKEGGERIRYYLLPDQLVAKLALIGTEVSEAIECVRRGEDKTTVAESGKPEGLPSEIADVVIRCLDLAGGLGIDLQSEIETKMAYNATRSYRHGGKAL